MRNKILSLSIAGLIMLGLLLANHFLHGRDHVQALASAGVHMDMGSKADKDLSRRVRYDPAVLLELNTQHIRGLLDAPGFVRYDAPTTVWQYRSSACVLDLYFTEPLNETFKPVVYYEIRAREAGVADAALQEDCMDDLLRVKSSFQMVGVNRFDKSLSE